MAVSTSVTTVAMAVTASKPAGISLHSIYIEHNKRAYSQLELLQIFAERATQVVAMQRELHRRLEKTKLVAGIVARAFKTVSVDGPVAQQVLQRVGELDLAAASRFNFFDRLEY